MGTNNGLLIFNRTDNGNVKPRAVIRTPDGQRPVSSNFRLVRDTGWIVSSSGFGGGERGISVWHITDDGDVPPAFLLTNPNGEMGGGRLALNPDGKEVILAGRTSVHVYSFPKVFD